MSGRQSRRLSTRERKREGEREKARAEERVREIQRGRRDPEKENAIEGETRV